MRSLVSAALAFVCAGALAIACSSSTDDASPSIDPSAEGGAGSSGSTPASSSGAPAGSPCNNEVKDGSETDVDCGGSCPAKCEAKKGCASPADCTTDLLCVKGVCASASATDGVKDGDETDIDCGGASAPPCEDGKGCAAGTDCADKVCKAGVCAPPSPTDGQKNGDETDVDCGGAKAPACADTKGCKVGPDCTSKICTMGACAVPGPMDGQKNGDETDVDCGGTKAAACADGKGCGTGDDCTSKVCKTNVCQVPNGTDGVKNGDESDVDCGGTTTGADKCDATKACLVHADCKSDGCDYSKKCAIARSCVAHLGGDTCGAGEAATDSCCKTAPLAGSSVKVDKYLVTAGRMRAMIERLAGNVRSFATGTAGWSTSWNALVPSTPAEANTQLGSYWTGAPNDADGDNSKRSCQTTGFGGHTYYTTGAGELGDYSQAQLDPKALNCVGWHLARTFCAWDGGRLPTRAEVVNAFTNNGANAYPWQFADTSAYNAAVADVRLNHVFEYGYPGSPRVVQGVVQDITWYVSPPGRFPLSANANGVQDMSGDLLHWVNDQAYGFTWTASWERHQKDFNNTQTWDKDWPGEPNGYYAIGFRCVHDP